jgi:hypothetical protein
MYEACNYVPDIQDQVSDNKELENKISIERST